MLKLLNTNKNPVRLVQITDCHLEEQVGGDLLGMDTDFSLHQVIDLIERERPDRELVLATGDISNRGTIGAYQRFKGIVTRFQNPIFWIKGNHDTLVNMQSVVGNDETLKKIIHIGAWQILLMDSTIEGQVGGHICAEELKFLKDTLQQYPNRPTLIFLHHHVVPIGSQWLDQQIVNNAMDFFAVINKHTNIKAVVSGHVHQEFYRHRTGVDIYTTPSTCIQFKPNSKDFCLDQLMPGYRWFELHQDGSYKTGVSRVPEQDFNVDFSTKGY